MKKTSRLNRLLTMLLALTMIVSSQGMTSMAAVIGGVTGGTKQTEAPQTETEAVTEAVAQTEAAQETELAGEAEPESESEGLTAAETEAETELTVETEAVVETEAPAETEEEIPAETEIEPEALEPEDTGLDEIIEDEEEPEGVYTYEDEKVTVTATVSDPAAFPEGTKLVAKEMKMSQEEIAAKQEGLEDGKVLLSVVRYDIHFENAAGEEIEPANDATVDIKLVQHEIKKQVEQFDTAEVNIAHVSDDGTVEELQANDSAVLENGDVQEVNFTAESFSTYEFSAVADHAPLTIEVEGGNLGDGTFYAVVSKIDGTKQIVQEIEVESGKAEPIEIEKLYNQKGTNVQNGISSYPVVGESYKVEIYALPGGGSEPIPENTTYKNVSKVMKKAGYSQIHEKEYILGTCMIANIPEITLTGDDDVLKIQLVQTGTPVSYKEVIDKLEKAYGFGVFTMKYEQYAHTEATIVADEVVDIQSEYNFSYRNFDDVNNKITITKTYTNDIDGSPCVGRTVEINLYREGMNTPVDHKSLTTDASGSCTFVFEKLTNGTYYFHEVLGGEEVETSSVVTVNGEDITVEYGKNTDLKIDQKGYFHYSYFNKIAEKDGEKNYGVLTKARNWETPINYVVLGDDAWNEFYSIITSADPKNGQAFTAQLGSTPVNQVRVWDEDTISFGPENERIFVVRAGSNSFETIDIPSYFGEDGILPNASSEIAYLGTSDDVVVYRITAKELETKGSDLNLSSQEGKFIIVNVDMSDAGDKFTYPGNYMVDNDRISTE